MIKLLANINDIFESKVNNKILENVLYAIDESVIVAITDRDGNITYVNKEFCRLSKYTEKELIGKNHRILKSDEHPQEFFETMWKTVSGGKIWRGEVKNKAKDGSYYWVKSTIIPFFDDGKIDSYIAIRYDITKRKNAEKKLLDTITQLKESQNHIDHLNQIDKMKEEFMCMITHELKTPLTPIIGWAEALKNPEIVGKITDEQLHAVEVIFSNAKKLQKLIGDILDARKVETNSMSFFKEEFAVDEMICQILDDYKHVNEDRNIEFSSSASKSIVLYSDKSRIEQVLRNLINNAIDFIPKQKGKIHIDAKVQDNFVLFSVTDNGKGIPQNEIENLFKKFYQLDTSATREHGGTGLGLSICKGIVNGLGGKIWAESQVGKGTMFQFSIPMTPQIVES